MKRSLLLSIITLALVATVVNTEAHWRRGGYWGGYGWGPGYYGYGWGPGIGIGLGPVGIGIW